MTTTTESRAGFDALDEFGLTTAEWNAAWEAEKRRRGIQPRKHGRNSFVTPEEFNLNLYGASFWMVDMKLKIKAGLISANDIRAGFTPAPPPPCKVFPPSSGGGGGFSLDQIAAQRRLLARPVAREAKRVDSDWGKA